MAYDPWDWSKQTQQEKEKVNGPLSNTIAPLQSSTEQAPPPVTIPVTPEKPNQLLQTAQGIAVTKGADKASTYIGNKYDAWKASQPAEPTYTMAEAPIGSAPLGAEAVSATPQSIMPAGLDMSGATTAGYSAPIAEIVPAAETATMSAAPLAAPASTVAGTYGVGTATAAVPVAAETAAATTGATAAGAAEAGLLASNPIGWGVGALLLAKSMNWI